jgi:hypothetical protein
MIGGLIVKPRLKGIPPSNLTGKYCFTSIAVLLASYVVEFTFGIWLMTIIAMVFVLLSTFLYGRGFVSVMKSGNLPAFGDKPAFRILRICITVVISAIFLFKLFQFTGWI